jgi:hypothetical protein
MTAWLAYEVELEPKQVIGVFFGTSILLALTTFFFLPTLIIAGASVGIFGLLGSTGIKGSTFIPQKTFLMILGSSVFLKYVIETIRNGLIIDGALTMQTLLHAAGFLYGIILFAFIWRYRDLIKHKTILQTAAEDY